MQLRLNAQDLNEESASRLRHRIAVVVQETVRIMQWFPPPEKKPGVTYADNSVAFTEAW